MGGALRLVCPSMCNSILSLVVQSLVALELRPSGPAVGVSGSKAAKSGQDRSSWHLQLPSQINLGAHSQPLLGEGQCRHTACSVCHDCSGCTGSHVFPCLLIPALLSVDLNPFL